ncbi:hypothetical protein [Streptomyces sp. NPDC057966]|uniref:hypothetical protein n=1 Tax=Streptomyces sp. NPDC057966 TaxID=3346292 RepID=UPI0036E7EE7E
MGTATSFQAASQQARSCVTQTCSSPSGPNLAREVMAGRPAAVAIACPDEAIAPGPAARHR